MFRARVLAAVGLLALTSATAPGRRGAAAEKAAEPAAGKPAPAAPEPAVELWESLTSPAEARGLYDQAAAEWLAAARRNPAHPGAEVALRRIAEVRGRLTSLAPLVEGLRELAANAEAPATAAPARELLAIALRDAGEWKAAAEAAEPLGFIRHWLAVGTFGRPIAAVHDRSFAPEDEISLAAQYDPGRYCALAANRWRALPAPRAGEPLEPCDCLRPAGGACYLLAQLEAREPAADAFLLVRTPAAFKVWVNGEQVYDGDRYRRFLPAEAAIPVRLGAGWNRILVKLSSPASVNARLARASGQPLLLPAERKLALHPPIAPAPTPAAAAPAAPFPWAESRLRQDASPAGRAALGVLERLQGLDDEAVALLKAAAAAEPDRAAWRYQLGLAYQAAEFLPAPDRRNLAAAEFRQALRCDGGFVPARLALAEHLAAENHEELALDELKAALAASPDCHLAWLEMASIARRLSWRNETRAWLAQAEKLAPGFPARRVLAAAVHRESGQLDRAIAECRELFKSQQASRAARGLLASALAARGEWAEAVRLRTEEVQLWPADPQAHLALAGALAGAGEHRKAAEACAGLCELVPGEAAYRRMQGEELQRAGDAEAAGKAYAQALALDPADHRLRRLLERSSGVDEDFSAPYALDIHKEIAAARGRKYDEAANAVLILDQTVVRVFPDGSASETIAEGRLLLTDRTRDRIGSVPIIGEFMEVRTIAKDGAVLEPAVIPGEPRLTMPGLEPGAAVEFKYRRDEPPEHWGGFYLSKWYFRSPNLDEPHQVSDYIVMIPKGLPHRVVRHNFDVPERVEEKDGLVVYRWTARNRPHVDAEQHMPHHDHYLPFVEIGTERSWQDVADSFKSLYLGRTRATAAVREAAAGLAAGRESAAGKARAIYDFVCDHVRHRGAAASAHQTLVSGAGDREGLFLALAEAAGLEAFQGRTGPAPACQGSDDEPQTWELPSEDLFTAEVVGVRLEDGRILWLDLSWRFLPFGTLRLELQGSRVLAVGRGAAFFDLLPDAGPEAHAGLRLAELEITAAGGLQAVEKHFSFGEPGARLKEQFAALDHTGRRNALQAMIGRRFPGAVLEDLQTPDLEKPGAPFAVVCRFSQDGYLSPAPEGRLACPTGLKPLTLAERLAIDPTRRHPLKISAPVVEREELRFRLPAGLEPAELPADAVLASDFGSYSLCFERAAGGGGFTVRRRALVPAQTVSPERYGDFAAFCRRVDEAEKKARVLLRRGRGRG